jgi:hypothetical protein
MILDSMKVLTGSAKNRATKIDDRTKSTPSLPPSENPKDISPRRSKKQKVATEQYPPMR